MEKKYSYQTSDDKGTLYLVATPIGNLQDMTFRAVETLRQSAVIAAEDTRQTRKLLTHFQIEGPRLTSYHEHNKNRMEEEIIGLLDSGHSVSLVSDAGTPGISDPGEDLVRAAVAKGHRVVPIPGACAAITALVASGMPTDQFSFVGFLPRERKERRKMLERWRSRPETLLFYEAPHRLKDTVKDLLEVLGNRRVTTARELTKRFEEFARGTLKELLEMLETESSKGEYVLVVEGADPLATVEESAAWWEPLTVIEHVHELMKRGIDKKEAIKQVAKERNLPKREVYGAVLEADEKENH
ncbi:16S rRNA (cytidine(1402)-2'-O)-methyltransferase [Effusibacillus lacus]|uniref:Ribosomal RNA small subunit methyltransferase I n=1 Tax=Effusibacillus lacus TaxID=1348429 RepID=A0A292YIJ1_9BACL|nr:16S rRNA (cytidine(1402)-2'-O)-methyltransferase [Effusibacillus lacus]TCS74438.1 16S rRNA (cytidine1402-2'-O)-methyltransferase [Effusibacillus lacus]GAX88689.1 rRNA (cytidine-2'-O-)-methyltransferase [Effusibacillus lacus]